ncbi:MAG: NlpC/P60 family protein [Pseudomonadota bacterium]
MSAVAELAVHEAFKWLGTPYRHQASCKGAGTDCLGLLRGIWRALYGREPELVPPYSADWSEPQGQEQLLLAAQRHLIERPIGAVGLGDVILFRMRRGSVAKHLGIQVETGSAPKFIHAYSGQGVELSPLSAPWERRIAARFAFPE